MRWKYKNTIFLVLSVIALFAVADTAIIKSAIVSFGEWGYLVAFFIGIFFVSTFTVAPSILVIYYLAQILNHWEVAVFAGFGAVIGDTLIFAFLKDGFFEEIKPLFGFFKRPIFHRVYDSPYFVWLLPLIGAAIIASPLPDEIGISLIGLSKIKRWQFIALSFFLNTSGLFIITFIAKNSG